MLDLRGALGAFLDCTLLARPPRCLADALSIRKASTRPARVCGQVCAEASPRDSRSGARGGLGGLLLFGLVIGYPSIMAVLALMRDRRSGRHAV